MERILFAITMVFFLLSIGSVLAYVCTVSCGEFWVNFETGGPYIKRQAFPTIFIVGNVNLANGTASYANVSIKIYEGSTLKASRNLIASSTGKFSETFRDIGIGSYDVEVSANYSLWTTYSNDSFKVIGMLAGCLEKNISLSGDALDYLTGSPISQGTVKIAIEENGDEIQHKLHQWQVGSLIHFLFHSRPKKPCHSRDNRLPHRQNFLGRDRIYSALIKY